MSVAPARRCRLIARFRSVVMTCGLVPAWIWDRSSVKVTSRTQCRPFSICRCPDPGGRFLGAGFVRAEVGDRVDGLGAPAALLAGAGGDRPGAADDLEGLAGVRELDPGGDRDHLQDADLAAAVTGLGAAMTFPDIAPREAGEPAT